MIFARRRGHGIALLIPFSTDHGRREVTLRWLMRYWKAALPGAEIIVGSDTHVPWSKTRAVNDAASRVSRRRDIFVLLDADGYLDWRVVLHCAREIRHARRKGFPLWYIPYRHFYRLTESTANRVLDSDPADPVDIHTGDKDDFLPLTGESQGHWWGALVQLMPREAFFAVGGMDTRFVGWGGEDVAFMRAVDTVYGRHKTTDNPVFHLWHPSTTSKEVTVKGVAGVTRLWDGQLYGRNDPLVGRYYGAFGDLEKMRRLVREYWLVKRDFSAADE